MSVTRNMWNPLEVFQRNKTFRKSWWIRLSTQHYCVVLEAVVDWLRSTFQADILLSGISKILFISIFWCSLACFNSLISYQQSQRNVIYLTFFFVWRQDCHVFFFMFLTFPRLFKVCLQHYDPTLRRQVSVLFQIEFRLYRRGCNSCISRMKSILLLSSDSHNQPKMILVNQFPI